MSSTAIALVLGTALVLAVLRLGERRSSEEGPGLLAGNEDTPGPSWLGPAMRVLISLIALGASLYVILSKKYDADTSKWAFGTAGTVIGFWLRGA